MDTIADTVFKPSTSGNIYTVEDFKKHWHNILTLYRFPSDSTPTQREDLEDLYCDFDDIDDHFQCRSAAQFNEVLKSEQYDELVQRLNGVIQLNWLETPAAVDTLGDLKASAEKRITQLLALGFGEKTVLEQMHLHYAAWLRESLRELNRKIDRIDKYKPIVNLHMKGVHQAVEEIHQDMTYLFSRMAEFIEVAQSLNLTKGNHENT